MSGVLNKDKIMCESKKDIFLELFGTDPADKEKNFGEIYRYIIRKKSSGAEVGECILRLGTGENVRLSGNIGYRVDSEHRGNGYAVCAVALLAEIARGFGMTELKIYCQPENIASARVAEKSGAEYIDTVEVPRDSAMYAYGKSVVRRYVLHI